MIVGSGSKERLLTESEVRALLAKGLETLNLAGKRVLVIIPDGTRSGPIPMFFRLLHELIGAEVAALDYLIALGTHPPMSDAAIQKLVGADAEALATTYAGVHIFNHRWDLPETFVTLGVIPSAEIELLSNGLFAMDVPITINKLIFDYDHIIICGPVFPHEVVGFSGGHKYFFPGISGPEVINFTHWLSAIIGNYETIGTKHTPVRAVIERAAAMVDVATTCLCFVVKKHDLHGVYLGPPQEAWSAAADLAAQTHILWVDRTYEQVLSVMPTLYDDIWTAAKGMYKLEPVIAPGGRVIIFAPHIDEISYTHGRVLNEIGYHVRDYFVKQWDRFNHYPWGVIAHATHFRGRGTYVNGIESPLIDVTLATGIPRARVEHVALSYQDPAEIEPSEWAGLEDEGVLLVPYAGEMLYRLQGNGAATA